MEDYAAPAPVARRDEAPWPFPRRFVALFTSPKALFEHLEQRPTWLVPLLVTTLFVIAYLLVLWNPVMFPSMMARMEEQGSPEKAVDFMTKYGLFVTLIPGILASLIGVLVTALIVWGVGGFLLGGKMNYRQALSLVSHTGLIALPMLAVMLPLALVSKTSQVSVGPGMMFPMETAEGYGGRFISLAVSSIDVFKFWQVALTALGVSVMARVARSKATVALFVTYFVFSLLGAAIFAAFGR